MRSLLFLVAFAVFLQDSAETSTVDPALSLGIGTDFVECTLKNQASISDLTNMMEKVCSKFTGISGELLLEPCISQEEWRDQVGENCDQLEANTTSSGRISSVVGGHWWFEERGYVSGFGSGTAYYFPEAIIHRKSNIGPSTSHSSCEARIKQLEEKNQVMQQQQQDMHEENRRIHDIVQKMEATLANFSENLGSLDQDPNKNSSNDDTLTPSTFDDDTLSPLVKIR
nr:putative transposase En/Spm [Ipomoea batatas]